MSAVELTEAFLADIAGWDVLKQARGLLASGKVQGSDWTPPILKGTVQEGTRHIARVCRKDKINIENMCSCRAPGWGTICSFGGGRFARRAQQTVASPEKIRRLRSLFRQRLQKASGSSPKTTASAPKASRCLKRAPAGEGEPAEIFVIFPPNLAQAIAKGRIMLYFEGKWNRGCAPLNALPTATPFRLAEQDLVLLEQIESLAEGDTPGMLMLSASALTKLLPSLAGHPRVTLGKSQPLTITASPWRLAVLAALETSGEITLRLAAGQQPVAMIAGETSWVFREDSIQPVGLPKGYQALWQGPMRIPRSRVPPFLNQDWPLFQANCDVTANFRLEDFQLESKRPHFRLALAGGLAHLQAHLQCVYDSRIFTIGTASQEETFWLPDADSPTRCSTQDAAAERTAQASATVWIHRAACRTNINWPGKTSSKFLGPGLSAVAAGVEVTLEEQGCAQRVAEPGQVEPQFAITMG